MLAYRQLTLLIQKLNNPCLSVQNTPPVNSNTEIVFIVYEQGLFV